MKKTALEQLRDELHLTRQEMADKLGISRSNVEKYEAVLTEELAIKALAIVRANGIAHLDVEFIDLANLWYHTDALDLKSINVAEQEFLKKCLRIYRSPKTDMQRGLAAFIEAISPQPSSDRLGATVQCNGR